MTAALASGLEMAKGLALAYSIPLMGVNHMQAHALTPRLMSALDGPVRSSIEPRFPYLSLLVSGGHTLLVLTRSLCEHTILAATTDMAIGDAIDKMARSILPSEELRRNEIMYGRLLERFVFGSDAKSYDYKAPHSRAEEIEPTQTRWGNLSVPFADKKDMKFTYSGLESSITRICKKAGAEMGRSERVELARTAMRIAFEHLATRVIWALKTLGPSSNISTLVVSGGVASNGFLQVMWVVNAP